jgi:hypothetical protein
MCLGQDLNGEPLGSRFKSSARSFLAFCDALVERASLFIFLFVLLQDMSLEPLG